MQPMLPQPGTPRPAPRPLMKAGGLGGRLAPPALLFLCLFLLNACALPALLRPLPPEGPTDALIPPDTSFKMDDGASLPARVWLPPAGARLQGVILALHGYTDSRDAWELSATVFAQAGYAVYAPDQRGFGGTATRGIWPGTARLV